MKIRFYVQGLNHLKLLERISKRNIKVYDVDRDKNSVSFSIKQANYKRMVAILKNLCYNWECKKLDFGKSIANNICVFAILVFFLISLLFVQNKVLLIDAKGISPKDVFSVAKDEGIDLADCHKLEKALLLKYSAKNVNISKKGIKLFVDFRPQDVATQKQKVSQIVANYNGIITKMATLSGTPLKKVGDSVVCGEVLIDGTIVEGDKKIEVSAVGEIEILATLEYTEEIVLRQSKLIRTGNKICDTQIDFLYDVFGKKATCNFQNYQTETKTEYLSNIFPLKRILTTYYEVIEMEEVIDFEKMQDYYISTALLNLQKRENYSILEQQISIQDDENSKIICITYKKIFVNNYESNQI